MVDRTEIQPRHGNGSTRQIGDLDGHGVAEFADTLQALAPTQSGAALTQRLDGLRRELAESRRTGEHLKEVLAKSTQRVQQLLGEREQLRSLLAARDVEQQRLNREIGALAARAQSAPGSPPAGSPPALFPALRSLLDKLLRARTGSRGAKPAALRADRPDLRARERRLVPWAKDRPPKDVLAVVVFGLSEAEIERVLQVVERYCTEHEIAPLLLTDNDAFELFRNRRVLFEFLPARSERDRLAPELDWQLYILRRLALIRRKWQPSRVVAFGRSATEVVQLWRSSPFEETPIAAALNGCSAGAELAWRPASPSATVQP